MDFIYFIIAIIWGVVWGVAVNKVIENKGYSENWFWWGFFFGFIALIVALSKPEIRSTIHSNHPLLNRKEASENNFRNENSNTNSLVGEMTKDGWKCFCGRLNPKYTGTCDCGRSRQELQQIRKNNEKMRAKSNDTVLVANNIKQYKELLDIGAITSEEYEAKKKELLNL